MVSGDSRTEIVSLVVATVLATIFVAIRLAIRHKSKLLAYDDWLLVAGLVLLYISDAGGFMIAAGGEGLPIEDVTPYQLSLFLKGAFFPQIIYAWMTPIVKLSILGSYLRIFGHVKSFRLSVYVLIALILAWWLGVWLTVMLQCSPIQKNWEPALPGHCIDNKPFFLGNSISNNVLDAAVLLLPVIPVLRLHMSATKKALVVASFMLGSLSTAASIMRTVSITYFNPLDPTQTVIKASVWTYVEPGCAIIAACLPFLANISLQKLSEHLQTVSRWSRTRFSSLLRSQKDRSQRSMSEDVERQESRDAIILESVTGK